MKFANKHPIIEMKSTNRFQDEQLRVSNFFNQVWVICPSCSKKAIANTSEQGKTARLFCTHCGYLRELSAVIGKNGLVGMPANQFFNAELWLCASYKHEFCWAYNLDHLVYLERYIGASLREHKDRTHFTLLEKLPKFYHEAKNRVGLMKLIEKLKNKE